MRNTFLFVCLIHDIITNSRLISRSFIFPWKLLIKRIQLKHLPWQKPSSSASPLNVTLTGQWRRAQIRSQDSKRRANVNEERHSGRATEILVVVSDGLATLTCTRTRDQGGGIRVYF